MPARQLIAPIRHDGVRPQATVHAFSVLPLIAAHTRAQVPFPSGRLWSPVVTLPIST